MFRNLPFPPKCEAISFTPFISLTSLKSCTAGQFFARHALYLTLKLCGFAMRIMR